MSDSRRFTAVLALALLWSAWLALDAKAQVPDPTQPASAPGAQGETLGPAADTVVPGAARLTAIVISRERRVAVVDGRAVRVGDSVGTARVIDIEPLGVKLLGPEGEIVLSIAAPPVKGKKQP